MYCVNCFKKIGTSPHNFADKMLYCQPECFASHRNRTNKLLEENKNEENKNKGRKG